MSLIKKALLILSLALFIILLSFSGFGLYLYYNPEKIKPMAERALSSYTGSSVTLESLSYSIKPLTVEAKNILIKSENQENNLSMELGFLRADMSIKGSFGRKSLVLNNIEMKGLSVELLPESLSLPDINSKGEGNSSFTGRLIGSLVGLFFFREVRFQSGEMLDGHIAVDVGDYSIRIDRIHAQAGQDKPIIVSYALEIRNPSKKIILIAPKVDFVTKEALDITDIKLSGSLEAQGVTLQGPDIGARKMDVASKFNYNHSRKKLGVENLRINGEDLAFRPELFGVKSFPFTEAVVDIFSINAGFTFDLDRDEARFQAVEIHIADLALKKSAARTLSFQDVKVKAEGAVNLDPYRIDVHKFSLSSKGLGRMDGSFLAGFGQKSTVRLQVSQAALNLEKGLDFLPSKIKQSLKPLTLKGKAFLKGQFLGTKTGQRWNWECDLESQLKENPYTLIYKDRRLQGIISGVIQAKGPIPDVLVSAVVKADNNVLSSSELVLEPFGMTASLSVRYPVVDVEGAAIQIPRARIKIGERDIQIDDISIDIPKGSLDIEKGSFLLPAVRFDSADLKNLLVAIRLEGNRKEIEIKGRETSILHLANLYYPFPPDLTITARDSIRITAAANETGPWNIQAELSLEGLTFETDGGNIVGENITLTSSVESSIDLEHSKVTFAASIDAGKGEALYYRYYLNLNKNPIITSGRGSFNFLDKYLELSRLKFNLSGILPFELKGFFKQDSSTFSTAFTVSVPRAPLKPIFEQFLLEPHKADRPILETFEMDGDVSGELAIKRLQDDWQAVGRLRWHGGRLTFAERDISLEGINLDLPVSYRAQSHNTPEEPLQGRLEVKSMKVPLMPEQSLDIRLDAGPNRISTESPTTLKTLGGDIQLGTITAEEIFGSNRIIQTSLKLDGLLLEPIVSRFWARPVTGTASGLLDPIRYERNTLEIRGQIQAKVFGGSIKLSELGAVGILTSIPVFKLNIEGDDLLLSQITVGTSFGEVKGVLKGHIRDFEIAFGQPQKFDLLLETVKKKGVPQRISVKAIDNIAQLGGGQSPFMGGLAGTFASFFKQFPYKKIGVRSTLENDMFTINGTIKENGTEYIIKRSGFSGVNVVNQNIDNRISFKDMVERIQRISGTEGPIIER